MNNDRQKTGYLESRFKLFYISDQNRIRFPLHYHDFHKIMIFLRGNVSYVIEGKQYELLPGDLLLVHAGELHRPIIHDTSVYERMVFYISPHFFDELARKGHDLFYCFSLSRSQQSSLLRLSKDQGGEIKKVCQELADSFLTNSYAVELYRETKFMEFLILLNRALLGDQFHYSRVSTANPTIQTVLKYINDRICQENLSIDQISQAAYLNRSYLMHLFKAETGQTIGKYITEKRLFLARSMIDQGLSVTEACYRSGFKNYAAFYYAYKTKYNSPPGTVD